MLRDIDEMWRFATAVVKSGMGPKSLNSPEKVLIALQTGAEVGLTPMQSIKNIAVINGVGAMWGDAIVGLVRRSPACKTMTHRYEGTGESRVCIVNAQRDTGDKCEGRFGYADAKLAGLLPKDTYKSYPDRMYLHRARGYVIHDLFPDLIMGLDMAEEVMDRVTTEQAPMICSGDEAPLNSLDEAAELLDQDAANVIDAVFDPSLPTPEELSDPEYAGTLF